jgi:hypothetical protein
VKQALQAEARATMRWTIDRFLELRPDLPLLDCFQYILGFL